MQSGGYIWLLVHRKEESELYFELLSKYLKGEGVRCLLDETAGTCNPSSYNENRDLSRIFCGFLWVEPKLFEDNVHNIVFYKQKRLEIR